MVLVYVLLISILSDYHWYEKVIVGQEWAMGYYSGGADNKIVNSIPTHIGIYTSTNRKGAIIETGSRLSKVPRLS